MHRCMHMTEHASAGYINIEHWSLQSSALAFMRGIHPLASYNRTHIIVTCCLWATLHGLLRCQPYTKSKE